MPAIRILIADDYKDWLSQIRLLLQTRPEWRIVGEVSDGDEAVRKAEELQPDLVLLDVGLPKLNGIEAARRIRRVSPNSRIVFVSLDNSLDVVQVALSTGAHGYVYKARSQRELLPAIDAALRDRRFVSSMIRGFKVTDAVEAKPPHRHEVLFYSDDAFLVENFTRFASAALEAGDVAIVIATESHRDSIVRRLKAQGVDVDTAIREGIFIPLDVSKALSTFMVNGMPDSNRAFEAVGDLIRAAAKAGKKEHPRVAACGECSPSLWSEGKADAAIRLEQLWDEIATIYEIETLCAYSLRSFYGDDNENVFLSICAEHSAVHSQWNS